MKLFKNQRGDAHMIVMFALLFGVIGIVGLAVSRATTTGELLGNGIYGNVNVLGPKAQKNPFANAKVDIYKAQDCPVSAQAQVIGASASASVCNAPSKASVSANADGWFSASLDPGDYRVFVDLSGFNDNNNRACSSANVTVKRFYFETVKLTCTESGISVLAVITPSSCTDRAGCEKPYANADGRIRKSSSTAQATPLQAFKTDANGAFIVKLPADTYVVTIVPNGSQQPRTTCKEQTVVVSSNKFTDAKITCVTTPPPPPISQEGTLFGKVVLYRGDVFQRELTEVKGTVNRVGDQGSSTATSKQYFVTNVKGDFMAKIVPGSYTININSGPGYTCPVQKLEVSSGQINVEVRIQCQAG